MNLQNIDKTLKLSQQFEDELNTFVEFLVMTKRKYIDLFSINNEVVLENITDTRFAQLLKFI